LKEVGDFMDAISDIPAELQRDYKEMAPISIPLDQQKKAMALVLQSIKSKVPTLETKLATSHAEKIAKLKELMKELD